MDSIAAAVNGHDLDAFVALHEPDAAVVIPPDGIRAYGHAEIRKILEPLFASKPSTVIDLHGILKSGEDMAMSHSHFTVSLTRNGERVTKAGMGTVVSRRQPDGTWRIVFDYPLRAKPLEP